jgi:hypothetical protein
MVVNVLVVGMGLQVDLLLGFNIKNLGSSPSYIDDK